MMRVKITLHEQGDDAWQVAETAIYDGDRSGERLGPILRSMEYEEAIKEAKRWTMLLIRQRNRTETEDDIRWEVEPRRPLRHIPKL